MEELFDWQSKESINSEVVIGISRVKAFFLALISLGLTGILGWVILKIYLKLNGFDLVFLVIILSLLIITACMACFASVKILWEKQPGLIVNNLGFKINIGPNKGDFISWNEIENLKIYNPPKGSLTLLIYVKNPEGILSRHKGIDKIWLKLCNFSHKTPVSISSTWLDCNGNELFEFIKYKLKIKRENS